MTFAYALAWALDELAHDPLGPAAARSASKAAAANAASSADTPNISATFLLPPDPGFFQDGQTGPNGEGFDPKKSEDLQSLIFGMRYDV